MAYFQLTDHFASFFRRLNPSPTFTAQASREYESVKDLLEDPFGSASALAPQCFLQGSYRQHTAIYDINDIDIVALCALSQPAVAGGGGVEKPYGRDEIFDLIAAPLLGDYRYWDKVRYSPTSMCIKMDLGIRIEILPVVFKAGTTNPDTEPFRLFRPERRQWEDGYARYHQKYLSMKNGTVRTGGNFIPMIKVLKHIRSLAGLQAVSFHIECLLYSLPDQVFRGSPADFIANVLQEIAARPANAWYAAVCSTPCGDRDIFREAEWEVGAWLDFHERISRIANYAQAAKASSGQSQAIGYWKSVLGRDFFPATVI